MSYLVYIAVCRVNQKAYIGMTGKSLKERRSVHQRRAKNGDVGCTLFYNALRKHGADAFDWCEIWRCGGKSACEQKEIEFIKVLRPAYNLDPGGRAGARGRKVPKAQRDRLRELGLENREKWAQYARMGPASQRRPVICVNSGIIYISATAAAEALGIRQNSISEICKKSVSRFSVGGYVFRYADAPDSGDSAKEIIDAAKRRQTQGIVARRKAGG